MESSITGIDSRRVRFVTSVTDIIGLAAIGHLAQAGFRIHVLQHGAEAEPLDCVILSQESPECNFPGACLRFAPHRVSKVPRWSQPALFKCVLRTPAGSTLKQSVVDMATRLEGWLSNGVDPKQYPFGTPRGEALDRFAPWMRQVVDAAGMVSWAPLPAKEKKMSPSRARSRQLWRDRHRIFAIH